MTDRTRKLGSRMLIVSSGIFLSRCLGLARDVVFAEVWGTGVALAAFIIAFTIPNLLRALFGEGAFNAAFVPLFTSRLETEGRESAWKSACRILSVVTVIVSAIVLCVMVGSVLTRQLVSNELAHATLSLLPWLMPYAVIVCLMAGFAAVLNSVERFSLPAFAQPILNLFLIAGALFIGPLLGTDPRRRVYGLVLCVLAAGVCQLGAHVWAAARQGFVFRFLPHIRDPAVRRFSVLLAPIVVGAGVVQLNVVVDRLLAGYLGSVATTTLYYSQRLVYLPVGLFGVAMNVVCLPALTRAWTDRDDNAFTAHFSEALRLVLLFALPSVALLLVLREPIVALLFERGSFDQAATRETAWTLLFYVWGIPAFVCAKVAVAPFHARQDTRTPVRIAVLCLALNVVLNIVLMQFLRQGGLALSTAICSYVNFFLLMWSLRRVGGKVPVRRVLNWALRMAVAGCAAGIAAHGTLTWSMLSFKNELLTRAGAVICPLAAGGIVYVVVVTALGGRELKEAFGKYAPRS
ncbi:MAG: murein biosynthesis integral membrane protein MurJ [Candidatus Pacebacteria bacterium]|nr:murein biosynthesis integral membrane protein MurJ [Candidatus Paceibacterota bacterium]